jgi:hypothetical protein
LERAEHVEQHEQVSETFPLRFREMFPRRVRARRVRQKRVQNVSQTFPGNFRGLRPRKLPGNVRDTFWKRVWRTRRARKRLGNVSRKRSGNVSDTFLFCSTCSALSNHGAPLESSGCRYLCCPWPCYPLGIIEWPVRAHGGIRKPPPNLL